LAQLYSEGIIKGKSKRIVYASNTSHFQRCKQKVQLKNNFYLKIKQKQTNKKNITEKPNRNNKTNWLKSIKNTNPNIPKIR